MKRLGFSLLIFLAACNTTPSRPGDILAPEKMQAIIWDILEADELTNYQGTLDSSINSFKMNTGIYKAVFRMHNVTEDEFRKSFRYYEGHPVLLKPVIDSLQKRSNRIITSPV
jgi:hypothetical protein